jgi:hypothetical protein
MGQSAHPGRAYALVAAAALVGATTVTGCSSSLASATTVLTGVVSTTVVHSDGTTALGVSGLRLRPGDLVRTGPGGRAELDTRTRHVYLGSDASLQVLDGENQQLRHGALVVDAQPGSGLNLRVAGLDVTAPDGSALRAERSVTTRLGALAGSSHVVSSTGRSLELPPLRQAVIGGDALPETTTPLRLTDDDGEAHAVPELVHDDEALNGLARGIDGTGAATATVVTAAWHGPLSRTPSGVGRSERVLPVVIATAGPAADVTRRYHSAVALRRAGGSWGVVAHLLDVGAARVVEELALLEKTQKPGSIGDARQILAAIARASGSTSGSHQGSNGGSNTSGGDGSGGGSGGGGGNPTPTPTPSSSQGLIGTVDQTVGQVLSLVPTPTSSPSGLLPSNLTSPLPVPLPLP